MVDANSLIEGHCKFRDGKKWKTRWAVVTKLSPVADCIQLQIYRDEKERARNGHTKASLSLQHFLAMESGFTLDKESHTLGIICHDLSVVLAFDNRERLIQWSVRIANNLGEGQQFLVQMASAPPKSKLSPGPVKLHVTDKKFCLTGGIPPKLLGAWEVSHLRRYGLMDGRLVFEGGSRCGKGEGVHVLVPDPPQVSSILDALDMSSKGQLVRMPSRRFGSVVDSPRKSMTSRLSEMRTALPAESSTNISMNTTTTASLSIVATISPTPRESRSAEELCSVCNVPGPGVQTGSFWMSSEASSRCDLDSCDNLSIAMCPEDSQQHVHGNSKPPLSPARNIQGQPLQIAKPLPSAMERCLSCMSKLGQQGQDVLSPSWTMDLGVSSSTSVVGAMSTATGVPQGSIGSGNSDRLSISSHGSSSGGGGVTEFCYDTPRSVLMAEMRRARANTPPGVFANNGMQTSSNSCCQTNGNISGNCLSNTFSSAGQTPPTASQGPCSSPHRAAPVVVRNGHGGCSNSSQCRDNTGGNTSSACGFAVTPAGCANGCHCQNHRRVISAHGNNGNSPIYYNSAVEQKVQGAKTPINLHPAVGPGPGPYENYDFPRCAPALPVGMSNQGNCFGGNLAAPSSMSTIDWAKKQAMDRSSMASSAMGSGSDSLSEFYDTPRNGGCGSSGCGSCCPNGNGHGNVMCHCCSPTPPSGQSQQAPHQQQLPHQHTYQQIQHSHYQNAASILAREALENYDVPPACPHSHVPVAAAASGAVPVKDVHPKALTGQRSVNGEGKMPLVTGSLPMRTSAAANPSVTHHPNPNAIYAQVDKSKKTPRNLPPPHPHQTQHAQNVDSCDNHPLYENRNAQHEIMLQQQPNYMNVEMKPVVALPPKSKPCPPIPQHSNHHQRGPMTPLQYPPDTINQSPQAQKALSNYVNLEFADSLQLYENSKEVNMHREQIELVQCPSQNQSQQQNQREERGEKSTVKADEASAVTDAVVEIKENDYENTRQESTAQNQSDEAEKNVESGIGTASGSFDENSSSSASGSKASGSGAGGSQDADDNAVSLPLRRSSSVPCKGGHANRGSASSSDSGVSGDGGLFFDDSSPLNDIGSLCLHESLPRKSQRPSPSASNGKNTSATSTPKPQESLELENESTEADGSPVDPLLAQRHYETIDELEPKMTSLGAHHLGHAMAMTTSTANQIPHPVNPVVAAVKSSESTRLRNPIPLVSDANSTSSGTSDMSDYIETLSSCSRGSSDTVTSVMSHVNLNISSSPKKSTNMKPRSGKEYYKIDRAMFKTD